ncbi:recombinase family protein [Microbacterium sp.]|uniref:recombinase family protein n=1 Tax=Microbacterium sp. TaxID=51671 RepID=UPI003A87F8A6
MDIDADGNSIATQRESCIKRCKRLKAPIVEEFVEPGNSAQSIAKRPVFRELLSYVEEHPEVRYVVIYMRSRIFRNQTDAAITSASSPGWASSSSPPRRSSARGTWPTPWKPSPTS